MDNEEVKASNPFLRATYEILKTEQVLSWPNLENFYPAEKESAEDIRCQLGEVEHFSFIDLTDGNGLYELKEILRLKDLKGPKETNEKLLEDLHHKHHEKLTDHFELLSYISVSDGALSQLGERDKNIIRGLIEHAFNYGKAIGRDEVIAITNDRLFAPSRRATGSLKGEKPRAASIEYLTPFYIDNPDISIGALADILESDIKNNIEKYGGRMISESTRRRYAKQIKGKTRGSN